MASLSILSLFIKEEYRTQSSMFRSSFLMYPVFILAVSAFMGLMVLPLKSALTDIELISLAHLGIFGAGIFVGGFALLQDIILERRIGGIRLLLSTPGTIPITYKEMFSYFYIKDIIYYLAMNVLPILFGLYLSAIVTGVHIDILLASLTFISAFIVGVSVSFAMSTLLVRSKLLFVPVLAAILLAIYVTISGPLTPLTAIGKIMPFASAYSERSIAGIGISLGIFIILSIFSLMFVRETPVSLERRQKSIFKLIRDRFLAFGKYSSLVAKEWLDLTRSGGMVSLIFSFVLPLLFLWGLLWLLPKVMTFMMEGESIGIEFNLLFYGTIIGFFSSLVYGWLNNLDTIDNYKTLPITMPDVIKSKLLLFCLLNTAVSVAYLSLICLSSGEFALLPFALYNMFMVSAYVGVVTAYLTGVFTNSLMFDYKVMTIYALVITPILILMTLLSFYPSMVLPGIVISSILGILSYFIAGKIDKKWAKTEFRI
jgi:hypothetical protein